jgi:hypothetical protein
VLSDDLKMARQIINAAKRITRPKAAASAASKTSTAKSLPKSKALVEISLPEAIKDREKLSSVTLVTNRAPLVLAFALVALSFSPHPIQPLSSRLSLAQAVVSLNSRTKAQAIGLEAGKTAEEEGWGEGFGTLRILGREVRTLSRPDVAVTDPSGVSGFALWGVDLDAVRKRGFSLVADGQVQSNAPIHTPHAAKNYLLKAFDRVGGVGTAKEREENAATLMGALELIMETWREDEVHGRAWEAYIKVRPDVQGGVTGWGQKGEVKLTDILELAVKA